MSNPVIDLDVFLPDDKVVLLGGRRWKVPGDMPLKTYLRVTRVNDLQGEGVDQVKVLEEMVGALVELFCWNVAGDDFASREFVEGQLRGMGLSTIVSLLGELYPSDTEDAQAGEDAAPADPSGPTPTPA